jgi:hypothetical protein
MDTVMKATATAPVPREAVANPAREAAANLAKEAALVASLARDHLEVTPMDTATTATATALVPQEAVASPAREAVANPVREAVASLAKEAAPEAPRVARVLLPTDTDPEDTATEMSTLEETSEWPSTKPDKFVDPSRFLKLSPIRSGCLTA